MQDGLFDSLGFGIGGIGRISHKTGVDGGTGFKTTSEVRDITAKGIGIRDLRDNIALTGLLGKMSRVLGFRDLEELSIWKLSGCLTAGTVFGVCFGLSRKALLYLLNGSNAFSFERIS